MVEGRGFSPEIMMRIRQTVQEQPELNRAALSRLVCQWLNWRRPDKTWAEMSCRVALQKLAQRNLILLPLPRRVCHPRKPVQPSSVLSEHEPLECELQELGLLELVPVRGSSEQSRLWKEMIAGYHYAGYQPLVGAQMRYLIRCHKGWLGALGFSAAARQVAARDRWIGWSVPARRAHREELVCNSRFLILPWVKVKNLASHVLALCAKRLAADWRQAYGYRPLLLETYVEKERFNATCYRAANWIFVGCTAGRGRQDRECRSERSVKDIYLHPLSADWKRRLCREPPRKSRTWFPVGQPTHWAQEEFSTAVLGDRRLQQRLMCVAADFYDKPQANIPQACESRAKTKAAYRLLGHRKLSMSRILAAHTASTVERMHAESVVLAVQDTTTLNYSTHLATEGFGTIAYRKDRGRGLVLHDTLAVNPQGVALGVLDAQVWARNEKEFGKRARRKERSIEEKESRKWLLSFEAAAAAQRELPQTTVISVGDREADIYELFELAHSRADHPRLLVRAEQDRVLADEQGHLWAAVEALPIAAEQEVSVPRRRASEGQPAQPARIARLIVRFGAVEIKAPRNRPRLSALPLWAVLAQEVDAPAGIDPLEWMLLTTIEVRDADKAIEVLKWYTLRWQVEVYHRTLKSGCHIEERQLGSVPRLENCLAVDMVVAWRILYMTRLGRQTPELPCTVVFEDYEWKALHQYFSTDEPLPAEPPKLNTIVRLVGYLGGHLGRKSDGEPGTQSLWRGLCRVHDISQCWRKFSPLARAP